MKKVLLLGALLSTMAFGAAEDFTHEGSTPSTTQINLKGKAINQVQISATESLDFGTVVVNASKNEVATITLTGENTRRVALNAKLEGDKKSALKIEFVDSEIGTVSSEKEEDNKTVLMTEEDNKTYLAVKYTPKSSNDGLTDSGTKVLLTATYTD